MVIASFLCLATLAFVACEKDDICGKEEPTTPNYKIQFFNYEDQEVAKNGLVEAYAIGIPDTIRSTGNTLLLPLRLDQPATDWVLQIQEVKGKETLIIRDTLSLKYRVNTRYLNKACGYISTFSLLQDGTSPLLNGQANVTKGNWIKLYRTETNEIENNLENENDAHFKVYY
ncbi:Uncharacterised protein [Myroides odoratus]|uniref:Uncharacterized protein n=2 Tax=Flavobacteriaceae TaxID=49546 RepID=A0A378S1P3_MYROD|nr:hypothetical protein Myrod_0496 [Myroides odoratus DSM 2801]EKB08660.1 hypothetical protein HMPREF9716_00850 [Myroides odoratus CIP 103059]QQU02029.1 hypothetical protein I6I88_11130 [Myroides odoratus]QQU05473.1 hypothetical protein I6I89_04590 [Myroides odoratus]STZ27995.1 Uncharacterised protein [Myroides odoratus]